jgi:putative addiction module component (TIGR02574 family)
MIASQIAEEIVDYLPLLSGEQQEAVLHVVRAFAEGAMQAGPDDAELLRRLDALKSGADKGFTWEEVKQRARQKSSQKNV